MKEFKTQKCIGAFALIDGLVRNRTTSIFGYPGGAILPIYDELYSWEKHNLIRHYLVRHEQGAAHAADGYSRSSGKVGVCFATSGPGATNLITGIATAQIDSVPIIVITGQVGRTFIGTDAFQEIDTYGLTLPIVKHSYVVWSANKISEIISEAFYIALNGRPGPVLIDIPKDVGLEEVINYIPVQQKHIFKILGHRFNYKTTQNQLKEVESLIKNSLQPLIYVGGGVIISNASLELKQFVEHYYIPVTTTLMGKGAFDEQHPLSLGMLGMHGTAYANFAVSNCDLLIAIGARFDDRVTGKLEKFACNAVIIHIDIDPAEISKNKVSRLSIIGDVKQILSKILSYSTLEPARKLGPTEVIDYEIEEDIGINNWLYKIDRWKELYPLTIPVMDNTLSPQQVISTITSLVPNAFFTTDVGQHQMWTAQFLKCGPRKWLSSSGLGTMGYGLPAAIGAQVAFPDKLIVCISGDSSFQMNLQELGTISQYKLPIKIFVINNRWQGMVRQWQESFYEKRYSHSNMEKGAPDLIKLGEAYNIKSFRIQTKHELFKIVPKLFYMNEPILVDFSVSEYENCYPMVTPGQSNEQMVGLPRTLQV
jgi:acetolactate synthase I/II/III large subunit